jgi:hypothetical protein
VEVKACQHSAAYSQLVSGFEGDFGGVPEGIEDAKQEIGGDRFGIAVEDGGDAGAGSTREACHLRVS